MRRSRWLRLIAEIALKDHKLGSVWQECSDARLPSWVSNSLFHQLRKEIKELTHDMCACLETRSHLNVILRLVRKFNDASKPQCGRCLSKLWTDRYHFCKARQNSMCSSPSTQSSLWTELGPGDLPLRGLPLIINGILSPRSSPGPHCDVFCPHSAAIRQEMSRWGCAGRLPVIGLPVPAWRITVSWERVIPRL